MKSKELLVFFIVLLFFSACTNSIYEISKFQNSDSLFSFSKEYKLTKNEKDFLNILTEDKYASLCSSHEKYLKIKK